MEVQFVLAHLVVAANVPHCNILTTPPGSGLMPNQFDPSCIIKEACRGEGTCTALQKPRASKWQDILQTICLQKGDDRFERAFRIYPNVIYYKVKLNV